MSVERKVIGEKDSPAEMSVGLPLYRARPIAWLALSSLARQHKPRVPWELLIAEEQNELPFGFCRIRRFFKELQRCECQRIVYLKVPDWISLAQKWRLLAANACASSRFFLFQAADCYAAPRRLLVTWKVLRQSGEDCFICLKRIMYNIRDGRVATFTQQDHSGARPGVDICIRTPIVRSLPQVTKRRGVDGWLWQTCRKMGYCRSVAIDQSDNWKYALGTLGLNNISHLYRKFRGRVPGFEQGDVSLLRWIPGDTIHRLRGLALLAQSWQIALPTRSGESHED